MIEGQPYRNVLATLHIDDRVMRFEALARLERQKNPEHLSALVRALDDLNDVVHDRAASALTAFRDLSQIHSELAARLHKGPHDSVRLACAILLMSTDTEDVMVAYRLALGDRFDKVVMLACRPLSRNNQDEDEVAVRTLLSTPSWRIRLEACKALIVMERADHRVVKALMKMSAEPEADVYDAEIEENERLLRDLGGDEETLGGWGKLDSIIHQAMEIASRLQ